MSVLAKAQAHWADLVNGAVDVPEWGVKVHFKRLTLEDLAKWQKPLTEKMFETTVNIIIQRALHEDGTRMFPDGTEALEAYETLMNKSDPRVVERIGYAIISPPAAKAATKN